MLTKDIDHGKCLAADESILINNSVVRGRDLIVAAQQHGTLQYRQGNEELYALDDLYTYSLDKQLRVQRTKASVFLERYKGKLYHLCTATGREVTLTPSHPLLVNRGGQMLWLPSEDLQIGDYIAVLRKIDYHQTPENLVNIHYIDELHRRSVGVITRDALLALKQQTNGFTSFGTCSIADFDKLRILLQMSKVNFCFCLKISNDTLQTALETGRVSAGLRQKLITFFEKVGIRDLKRNEVLLYDANGRTYAKITEFTLDDGFIKFLAFLFSEGGIHRQQLSLSQSTCKDMRDEVITYLNNHQIKSCSYLNKDYQIHNKLFIEYLEAKFNLHFRDGFTIPQWVLGLSKEHKRLFLRWFFTFEAWEQSTSGQVYLTQKRKENITILGYLLAEFSVLCSYSSQWKCATNTVQKRKGLYYKLCISGKENLLAFIREVGFQDDRKNRAVLSYVRRVRHSKFGKRISLPIANFKKLVKQQFGNIRDRPWFFNAREVIKKGHITETFLKRLLLDARKSKKNYFNAYQKILESNIFFDKLATKQENDYDDYLVDLVVPQHHTFFAGHGGILCHNTSLTEALTGKFTDTHSEEIKRGITIRLGYADAIFYKCTECKPEYYTTKKKCEVCKSATIPVRKVSFIDAPGHESLMATMLSGAAIIDGAMLLVAANEECPQPQTKEHLMALQIIGLKNIVIVQNKIDIVSKEDALKNYQQIKDFVKGTIAEGAPIIPISALHRINIGSLIQALEETVTTLERNTKLDPLFLVARSFDVNRPGTDIKDLTGGVLGGALKQGVLHVGDAIEIRPGMPFEREGKKQYQPITTTVAGIKTGGVSVKEAYPGGSLGVLTELDPFYVKSDSLSGNIIGLQGKLPPVWYEMDLKPKLLERLVGSKEEVKIDPLKKLEPLMLNVNSAATVGIVTELKKDVVHVKLKIPVCCFKEDRFTVSRMLGNRWRLIGTAQIVS